MAEKIQPTNEKYTSKPKQQTAQAEKFNLKEGDLKNIHRRK